MARGKKYVVDVPRLYKQWDYEKNTSLGLFPDKITCGSHKNTFKRFEKLKARGYDIFYVWEPEFIGGIFR